MRRTLILLLLFLPGIAFSAICKSIGADGVASFINVPGNACPPGSTPIEYPVPAPTAEQIRAVESGISGRQIPFAGYKSIEITSPEDGGTVRSNEGRVKVTVAPDPRLQSDHFITAYLDGKARQGRYGNNAVEFVGVDRGEHTLYVTVKDSKGKVLSRSDEIRFTLQKYKPNLVVNPISGDDYVSGLDPNTVLVRGLYTGASGTGIYLRFPVLRLLTKMVPVGETKEAKYTITMPDGRQQLVTETYNWEIPVPRDLLASESSFEAIAKTIPDPARPEIAFESKTTSTHSVDPELFQGFTGDRRELEERRADYLADEAFFEADRKTEYKPSSSTPDKTNPAFGTGTMSTPGQLNPAFDAGSMSTPGQLNPAYTNPAAK
jgi:hypothetical protein